MQIQVSGRVTTKRTWPVKRDDPTHGDYYMVQVNSLDGVFATMDQKVYAKCPEIGSDVRVTVNLEQQISTRQKGNGQHVGEMIFKAEILAIEQVSPAVSRDALDRAAPSGRGKS